MDHESGSGADPADGPGVPDDDREPRAGAPETEPATGDPRVDAALRPLAGLAGRPVTEHPQVFERLHGELVEVLGELGSAGGQAG